MKTLPVAILCFLTLFFYSPITVADIVYSEGFTGQNGKGAVGPGGGSPTIDLSGVDWSVDVSAADLSATDDWFRVESEVFEGRDLDGPAIWSSPVIDISGFSDLSFSLEATEVGTQEAADYFDVSFSLDGATATKIIDFESKGNAIHTLNDDFGFANVIQSVSAGSTLQIFVEMLNNAGTEFFQLDNVSVSGVPEPSAFLFGSLLTGVAGLAATRRRDQ